MSERWNAGANQVGASGFGDNGNDSGFHQSRSEIYLNPRLIGQFLRGKAMQKKLGLLLMLVLVWLALCPHIVCGQEDSAGSFRTILKPDVAYKFHSVYSNAFESEASYVIAVTDRPYGNWVKVKRAGLGGGVWWINFNYISGIIPTSTSRTKRANGPKAIQTEKFLRAGRFYKIVFIHTPQGIYTQQLLNTPQGRYARCKEWSDRAKAFGEPWWVNLDHVFAIFETTPPNNKKRGKS